jgi:hypothetical protein
VLPQGWSARQKLRLFVTLERDVSAGFDLHGNVHVAVRAIVAAGNAAKHRQVTHATTAQLRFLDCASLSDSVECVRRHGAPAVSSAAGG